MRTGCYMLSELVQRTAVSVNADSTELVKFQRSNVLTPN